MKLDILVLAAHPDDAELSCGGTLLDAAAKGKKTGVIDFTRGEMGSRGTPELRIQEAEAASRILGLSVRENLGFRDVFFTEDEEHLLQIVRVIRQYRPEIVIANAVEDRHPDHGKAARLSANACFVSGLAKVITHHPDGTVQQPWRPRQLFHFIQSYHLRPTFVVDISAYWEQKTQAIMAYASQFHTGGSSAEDSEPQTFISTPAFMDFIHARAREFGQLAGVQYAEGFTTHRPPAVPDLFAFTGVMG